MIDRVRTACTLLFVAAVTLTLSGATDDALKVEVERPRLVADKAEYPILAGINLVFDARFTNEADTPVEIPDRADSAGGVVGIFENGVKSQQSDGSWRTEFSGGDLLWKGSTVFPDCKLLGPKETLNVKGVSGPLADSKSNLLRLGTKATIRLSLVLPCKQRDGNVVAKTVQTVPFVLSIPPLQ